jgi:REP element-mobilizing transposase RayT/ActR/RegA family two-component response regulator
MAHYVLMVMSDSGLSDLIERALEERGGYNLVIVDNSDDALELCLQTKFDYALLDIEMAEEELSALSNRLLETSPGVRLLVVPREGDYDNLSEQEQSGDSEAQDLLHHEHLLAEVTHFLLAKQYAEDGDSLKATTSVGRFDQEDGDQPADSSAKKKPDSLPAYLDDADRAAQKLAGMSFSPSVLAAMIIREGELWAYAGQLSQPIAQELALCVNNYWNPEVSSDLARYTNLNSSQSPDGEQREYMLYATGLGKGIVLALAFGTETPFSQIRAQVNGLAGALKSNSSKNMPTVNIANKKSPGVDGANTAPNRPQGSKDAMFFLGDVPPPTPSLPIAGGGEKSIHFRFDDSEPSTNNQVDSRAKHPSSDGGRWEKSTCSPVESMHTSDRPQIPTSNRSFSKYVFPNGDEIPSPEANAAHSQGFTHGMPAFYSLHYACLLLPRLPGHQLVGDLSAYLPRYVRQIFLAYGWRMKYIDIKPESLQWIASLPPHVPPGKIVSVVRRHTSERIFKDFPRLAAENPSGDFWAPGYLLMSGQSMLPERVTKYFIEQTRRQQGL